MSRPRLVVVGGGLAGLSAAVTAVDAGWAVTLVEARARLGGAAGSFRRGNMIVDTGQHVFLRCCTAYRALLARLGTSHLAPFQSRLRIAVLADGGRRAWLRRSALPAPLHLGWAVARYPFLTARERLGVVRAARALARLDRADPRLDQHTFGAWLAAHGQTPASLTRFWDLFALPTLNLPAGEASLQLAAVVFQTGLLERHDAADIAVSRVPLEQLHATPAADAIIAAGGRVRTGVRAVAVGYDDGRHAVRLADGSRLPAEAVVLAVPHDAVADLLPARGRQALGASPIVNIHVLYDRRVTDLDFAAAVDTPVQWLFDRTRSAGYRDGQYLVVSVSAAQADMRRRTADLCDDYVAALARLLPAARRARVRDAFVTRHRAATFHQGPGVRARRPGWVTETPGVYLAGAWVNTGWPATMEGAVRSGRTAALAAVRHPSLTTMPHEEAVA